MSPAPRSRVALVLPELPAPKREDLPELSGPEWDLIRDVMNGHALTVEHRPGGPYVLPGEVLLCIRDGIQLDRLDLKWQLDGAALVDKAVNWSREQETAVALEAARWWHDQ